MQQHLEQHTVPHIALDSFHSYMALIAEQKFEDDRRPEKSLFKRAR